MYTNPFGRWNELEREKLTADELELLEAIEDLGFEVKSVAAQGRGSWPEEDRGGAVSLYAGPSASVAVLAKQVMDAMRGVSPAESS